eukprot:7502227-Pyramimonas_sp.AAC.1
MKQLQAMGHARVDEDTATHLLKNPLECHRCRKQLPNMPALKVHLGACDEACTLVDRYPNELTHEVGHAK